MGSKEIPVIPLVSVCVATYQHANFIEQCLDSILMQQTSFQFEIIIGEDESTDGTRILCIKYANKYPEKIRLFLRSRKDVIYINGKPTGRYNFVESLKACRGRYIAICEGDDYWTDPLKLQKQVDFLEIHNNFVICFHKVLIYEDEILKEDYITSDVPNITNIENLAVSNFMHTPSLMFRNYVVKEFPQYFFEAPIADYFLTLLLAKNGKIKCIPEIMAVYRKHKDSYWSSRKKIDVDKLGTDFLINILPFFESNIKEILLDQYYRKCFRIFKYDRINNFIYLLKCIRLKPMISIKKGLRVFIKGY